MYIRGLKASGFGLRVGLSTRPLSRGVGGLGSRLRVQGLSLGFGFASYQVQRSGPTGF